MIFDLDMIKKVYAEFPAKVDKANATEKNEVVFIPLKGNR